jgi:DNA-binding MarR family transcriptional regulator
MPAASPAPQTLDVVSLADALRPPLLRIARLLRLEAQKAGISAQDSVLLSRVKAKPGIGVSALAELEHTSRPTMSAHLKRLEAAGFVRRGEDAQDGRRSGFTITAAGARKLEQIRTRRNDWLARQLAGLDDAERDDLARAAEALLKLSSLAA